jgi:signal transduction histidine kinase
MPSFTASDSEEFIARLAHDLRQPLGTIETSAYCMNLLLGQEHTAAREQLRLIERQVGHAVRILNEAVEETRHRHDQRAKTATAAG